MAIQSRRGNISNFDKSKMLPGEWGIALDSQEAFVCFGAGITKKMATYEDYQDMIDDCVEVTQTAQGVVDSFNSLEIEKLAIDDTSVSLITGWSSDKITKYDTKDNVVTFTEATTRENIATGEKHSVIFGKIKKFFADLKTVAFTGKYNDLTNVAIENPTTLPTASADTLGKIYRDGTGLKITLRSGIEGSYTYSWVPFISKDKVVNSFNVTEDGFVADARGLKVLKDGLDGVNNNLQSQNTSLTKLWIGNNIDYAYIPINNQYKFIIIVQGTHVDGNNDSLNNIDEYRMIPACGMSTVGASLGFSYTAKLGNLRFRGDQNNFYICTTVTTSWIGVYGLN